MRSMQEKKPFLSVRMGFFLSFLLVSLIFLGISIFSPSEKGNDDPLKTASEHRKGNRKVESSSFHKKFVVLDYIPYGVNWLP